jgi:SAM-dependent methyltransferase
MTDMRAAATGRDEVRAARAHQRPAGTTVDSFHRVRTACRACGGTRLEPFLVLGPQPLANAFLKSPDEFRDERFYPLDVYFCEGCSLVQLADVIDPELLFGHYLYVTGTSESIAAHNVSYARALVEMLGLGATDLVVEVASNDGSLLACFQAHGVRTLGVEPARNIAELAQARGVPTEVRFFDGAAGGELRTVHGAARVVIGNNVLAHVDEPRDFLTGARDLLADDGLAVFEVPYARDMVERVEYDTIYHEHLCYFTVTSLARLGEAAGLGLVRVEHVPVHGGSLRVFFSRQFGHSADVVAWMAEERAAGLTTLATYQRMAVAVVENRRQLRELIERLSGEGRVLAAYGAPAKGNTLLNYCGLGTDVLPYTVDRNPLKIGLFTPGMHLPVLAADALAERRPDDVLILAWNFAEEIVRQQAAHRERGGRFIVPIPKPRVL